MHDGKCCLTNFSMRALINMRNNHAKKMVQNHHHTTDHNFTSNTTKHFKRTSVAT